MKYVICLILLFLTFSCKDPISSDNNQINFRTGNNSYLTTDSIKVFIENDMNSDFEIFLRCGSYLEMYYQKKDNDSWSKNLWFSWMSLKCISVLEKIKRHDTFEFIIPSKEIGTNGTYRLILANDTSIVSNSFEIK